MPINRDLQNIIHEAALNTPDPERAERNLLRYIEGNPDITRLSPHLLIAARLLGVSQFLANYCMAHPEELFAAIKEKESELTRETLNARAGEELSDLPLTDIKQVMKVLRLFKKQYLLMITLRDITGESDIQASMNELTFLAETIISVSLQWSLKYNQNKYGLPDKSSVSIIAVGKLGGEELNYSSDVDLMAVYENDEGQTSGTLNPSGVLYNRISNHEFYCKVIEILSKVLSSQTEDGIAYRVDLRLRPQGQKGDIALPLKAYRTYYESWGRTWERMMLIRARPVAGDARLGQAFIETVRPFVWREVMDFSEIEEIRGLKKKIDSVFTRDDIKRGYGGIREAEFFIQTFQLLFGAANTSLRSYRILDAIRALKETKKVPQEDLTILWNNYLYLRRIEHYLQMKEDLQTHTLPTSDEELEILAKKMGLNSGEDFFEKLRVRRMQIKSMYNSLLGSREDAYNEVLNLLESGLRDSDLTDYLSFRKVKDPVRGLVSLKKIREHMLLFHTSQELALSRQVIPQLLETALTAEDPDRALAGIERLLITYGLKTAHMTAFLEQKELITGLVKIFSMSPYLTRVFLSSQYYLDILIEEWSISKTLKDMEGKLQRAAEKKEDISFRLARYKRFEEVRLGMLLLLKIVTVEDLLKGLSQLAEAIIKSVIDSFGCRDLSIIAFGKLGGREMTFGSDVDIVFVSESPEAMVNAEKILRVLTTYSDMGLLYEVDTRLRPDGSKGNLVNTIEGYRNYYLEKAKNWELQALLKARPVGGDMELARAFIEMGRDVILKKGHDVRREDVRAMRERIIRELSREAEGLDIKLGPGGVEEIEFYVQYLQLYNAHKFPDVLVQNTLSAINRLAKKGLLAPSERDTLYNTYKYYRKLQTFLKLNEIDVIKETPEVISLAADFMEFRPAEGFPAYLKRLRNDVLEIILL